MANEAGKKSFFSRLVSKKRSTGGTPKNSGEGATTAARYTPGGTLIKSPLAHKSKAASAFAKDIAAQKAKAKQKAAKKPRGRFARWFNTLDPNMVLVKDFMVRGRMVMRKDRFQSMESLDWYLGIDAEVEGY